MKKYLVVFGVISTLFLMQAIPAESASVTYGGTYGGNQFALVSLDGQTWDEAKADVLTSLGSNWHLAVITNQDIQNFVYVNLVSHSAGIEYWLGGYQNPINEPVATNGWMWVTGASLSYSNWAGNEPNDYYGPASEQYIGMWAYSGLWYDEGNSASISGYIAESPVPVPAAAWLLGSGLLGLIGIRKRLSL